MESGTTINRGNENLFDDASFLPFPRFLGFHRVSHVTSEPIGDTRLIFSHCQREEESNNYWQ